MRLPATQRLERRLRLRLAPPPPAGREGSGATSAEGFPLLRRSAFAVAVASREGRTSAPVGHGTASPAAHAGGSPFDHLPMSRRPIMTIQKAGTICSSAPP